MKNIKIRNLMIGSIFGFILTMLAGPFAALICITIMNIFFCMIDVTIELNTIQSRIVTGIVGASMFIGLTKTFYDNMNINDEVVKIIKVKTGGK